MVLRPWLMASFFLIYEIFSSGQKLSVESVLLLVEVFITVIIQTLVPQN